MKLPNRDSLLVEREKVVDYLLNPLHRHGATKCRSFESFGFRQENWPALAEALRSHGQTHAVKRTFETGFGPRFEIDGVLKTPDGRFPYVRTVWQWDEGAVAPRLITAYPVDEK